MLGITRPSKLDQSLGPLQKGQRAGRQGHAHVCEPSSVLKLMGRSPQKFLKK